MAMNDKTFSEALTFTRASTKWVFDGTGTLAEVPVDQPAYDHDPVTGEALGVLIEPGATNGLSYSTPTAANWVTTNASITDNALAAPDGSLTAAKLVPDAVTVSYVATGAKAAEGPAATVGVRYTYSCYMKAGELPVGILTFQDLTNVYGGLAVDLRDGTILDTGGGNTGTLSNFKAVPVGDGWYRLSFTHDGDGAIDSSNNFSVAGAPEGLAKYVEYVSSEATFDGTSGLYIWGAQLETGPVATSYIPTAGAAVTRAADNMSRNLGAEFNGQSGTWFVEFTPVYLDEFYAGSVCYPLNAITAEGTVSELAVRVEGRGRVLAFGEPLVGVGYATSGQKMRVAVNENFASLDGRPSIVTGKEPLDLEVMSMSGRLRSTTSTDIQNNVRTTSVRYYPYAMTAAELEALTTL